MSGDSGRLPRELSEQDTLDEQEQAGNCMGFYYQDKTIVMEEARLKALLEEAAEKGGKKAADEIMQEGFASIGRNAVGWIAKILALLGAIVYGIYSISQGKPPV